MVTAALATLPETRRSCLNSTDQTVPCHFFEPIAGCHHHTAAARSPPHRPSPSPEKAGSAGLKPKPTPHYPTPGHLLRHLLRQLLPSPSTTRRHTQILCRASPAATPRPSSVQCCHCRHLAYGWSSPSHRSCGLFNTPRHSPPLLRTPPSSSSHGRRRSLPLPPHRADCPSLPLLSPSMLTTAKFPRALRALLWLSSPTHPTPSNQ